MADITLEQAQAGLAVAVKKSQELGVAMDIAVVDAGTNLKAFARHQEPALYGRLGRRNRDRANWKYALGMS